MKSANKLIADIDTTTFQLKLRAIAKHTAALADELDEIDQAQCPECGSRNTSVETTKVYGDDVSVVLNKDIICFDCNSTTAVMK